MHVWSPVAIGAIDLICGPLRPCVFTAELSLVHPEAAEERAIPGVLNQADGTYRFHLSAADVQAIKTTNDRLVLRTEQTLIPGSPDPRWGWRYTIDPAPAAPTVTEQGNPVQLDAQGYFNTPLAPYPNPPVVLTNKSIKFQ
jgi:hypothetical protein